MQAQMCKSEVNVAADSVGQIWDKRLGHMSEKGLHLLADQRLLLEVKGVHLEKCVDCLDEKQNKAAFHSRPPRRREVPLELVHTDVCYVDAPSHRGGQYFVTFIDDYSQKLWAFVLESKDQVLSFFKEFQARAQRDKKLKVVQTNKALWSITLSSIVSSDSLQRFVQGFMDHYPFFMPFSQLAGRKSRLSA